MDRETFLKTTATGLLTALTPRFLRTHLQELASSGFEATYDVTAQTTGLVGRIRGLIRKDFKTTGYLRLQHTNQRYILSLEADDVRRRVEVHGDVIYNSPLQLTPQYMQVTRLGEPRFELQIQDNNAHYKIRNQPTTTTKREHNSYDPLTGLLILYTHKQPIHVINHANNQLTETQLHLHEQTIFAKTNMFWSFNNQITTRGESKNYQGISIPQTVHLNEYTHRPGIKLTNLQAQLKNFKTF